MKVVLAAAGSRGDVVPFAALAEELVVSGHSAVVVSHASYARYVPPRVSFSPVDSDPELLLHGPAGDAVRSRSIRQLDQARTFFTDFLESFYEPTRAAIQGADLLVASTFATPAVHAALQMGIPVMRAHTWPQPDLADVQPLVPYSWVAPRITRRPLTRAMSFVGTYSGGVDGVWRRGRLRLTARHPVDFCSATRGSLHAYSPAIAQVRSAEAYATGWWWPRSPMGLSADTRRTLDGEGPWVYIGFGSMPIPEPAQIIEFLNAEMRLLGAKALLQMPAFAGQSTDRLRIIGEEAHAALFPRVHAAVHHGGSGTCGSVLRAGIPSVIVPFFGDQFFWARTFYRLGLSSAPARLTRWKPGTLARRLDAALSPRVRREASRIGQLVACEGGTSHAVAIIEERCTRASRDC